MFLHTSVHLQKALADERQAVVAPCVEDKESLLANFPRLQTEDPNRQRIKSWSDHRPSQSVQDSTTQPAFHHPKIPVPVLTFVEFKNEKSRHCCSIGLTTKITLRRVHAWRCCLWYLFVKGFVLKVLYPCLQFLTSCNLNPRNMSVKIWYIIISVQVDSYLKAGATDG